MGAINGILMGVYAVVSYDWSTETGKRVAIDNIKGLLISRCVFISQLLDF